MKICGIVFFFVVSFFVSFNFGYSRGVEKGWVYGKNQIIKEGMDAGAIVLLCGSKSGEVEILWITREADRKKVHKIFSD